MNGPAYCDNCNQPMVNATHHRAEVCPHGDTDQCLLCTSHPDWRPPRSDEIEAEILGLASFATDPGVSGRLVALAMELDVAYKREGNR